MERAETSMTVRALAFGRRWPVAVFCQLAALLALTPAHAASVTFDGTLHFGPGEEWSGARNAVQDNYTGYGDQLREFYSGSELDELYVHTDGTYLYIAVTGNLEQNGNAQVILLDVRPGGQNVLATEIAPIVSEFPCSWNGPPYALQGLGQGLISDGGMPPQTIRDVAAPGTRLDTDFEPDYAIAVDTYGGNMSVTQYELFASIQGIWDDPYTSAGMPCGAPQEILEFYTTRTYLGSAPVNGGTLFTLNSQYAYNNTGSAGVTAGAVSASGSGLPGDPHSQTTGLEAMISLYDLGFTSLPLTEPLAVKIAVVLTGGGGLVSNQVLPGIGHGLDNTNLNWRPDFTAISSGGIGGDGKQYATLTLTPASISPVIDGANVPAEFAGDLVASQDTVTGFGDHPVVPDVNGPGSEIDQLFVAPGTSPDTGERALLLGITGNLQPNSGRLLIFLDTKPGGQSYLSPDASQKIAAMLGDVVPLWADYVVVLNTDGSQFWVDLDDLQAVSPDPLTRYIGSDEVNQGGGEGNGILSNTALDDVLDWRVRLNNGNVVGVSRYADDDPLIQRSKAMTATTGWELSIPLSAIGSPLLDSPIAVFAMITNNNSWWLSNQFLPAGLGGGRANFDDGNDDLVSAGYQPLTLRPEVTVSSWTSCNIHAGMLLPITLNALAPAGTEAVEPRNGGIQEIQVTFNADIHLTNASLITVTSESDSYPPYIAVAGSVLSLSFPPGMLPDRRCYTITIGAGALEEIFAGASCHVRALSGDTTGNGAINLGDVLYLRARIGEWVDSTNAALDVDQNGIIDEFDMAAVKPLVARPAATANCP